MNSKININSHIVTQAIRALPLVEQLISKVSPRPTEASPNPDYDRDHKALDAIIALVREVRAQSNYDEA